MAQSSSPQKLPRGKADTYNLVALSDMAAITPLLSGLSIATCNPSIEQDTASQLEPLEAQTDMTSGDVDGVVTVSTRMSCTCCAVEFSHRTEQKAHFKSDWHRYNLKQQLRGEASVTEEAFEARTGDVSSISGSDDTSTSSTEDDAGGKPSSIPSRLRRLQVRDSNDSSDSEGEDNSAIMAATRRHPKVFLRNGSGQLISLYRCVLYHKKWAPSTPAELLSLAEGAKNYTRVAMVMLAGGHFSAAIFQGTEAVVHKTFHRYVVRAKRGTVQSVKDGQGSAPKSGGASLRRYNEAALHQEIQELLAGWASQLQGCHLIFLRTSAYSRHVFFGGKNPILNKDDPRVRTVPFTTGRPTFNEAKRVHHMLMAVECFGDESLVTGFVPVSPPRRLHPETGQLVVRPDNAKSGREAKAKARKDKGDTTQEGVKQDQEEAAAPEAEADQGESDREVELVTVTEVISTQDLQEFACSVGPPKRNRKKKKKGGQKNAPSDKEPAQQTAQGHSAQETQPQLSEEDAHLKNRLYTCCKSGDVTQLTQLLQELRGHTHHDTASTTITNPLPPQGATAHSLQCNLPPQLQRHSPSSSSSSSSPDMQAAQTHLSHSVVNARTSSADSVGERTADRVGEDYRTSEDIVCEGEQQSSDADAGSERRPGTESCGQHSETCAESRTSQTTSTSDSEPSLKASLDTSLTCLNSAEFSQSPTVSQNLHSEGVSLCVGRVRFESVVLGRYGDRGSSLLHVAASSGHGDIISFLLDAGCDPCVRDSSDKTPYSVASTKDVRNVFRRFRGNHPQLYDYDSAQIPEALTAEMEQERKQREAEKRKQQKKAKQERLKERKAEEAKAAQEQKEKSRFLALSDREKRALAAERRILAQASEQGASVVLIRCFQCGADMSGKVPFEYMDYKFCSPRCLKEHRMKPAK